jgi:hypothetical protein
MSDDATPTPAEPFTPQHATVYVNHLVVEYLRGEVAGFKALVADEAASAQDRTDAGLVVEAAERAIEQLVAVNNLIMAEQQVVKVASVIEVPGARRPRSLQ